MSGIRTQQWVVVGVPAFANGGAATTAVASAYGAHQAAVAAHNGLKPFATRVTVPSSAPPSS